MNFSEFPRDFIFSQSSLQDFFDCPRRFHLKYVQHLSWPSVEAEPVLSHEIHMQKGQHFHRLAHQFFIGLPVECLTKQAESSGLSLWWDNFLKSIPDHQGYDCLPEMTLGTSAAGFQVMGKYDLVMAKPGEHFIIYDWKTNSRRPRDEWMANRLQTRLYQALIPQAGAGLNHSIPVQPVQVEMVYWYAEFPGEPTRFQYTHDQFSRDWDFITNLISHISRLKYFPPAENDKKCLFCRYRSYCDRGIRAGDMNEEYDSESSSSELDQVLDFDQIIELEF